MKFGICLNISGEGENIFIEHLGEVAKMGFDYIELNATKISTLNENECAKLKADLNKAAVPALAANVAYPAELKLVGESVDMSAIKAYLHNMLAKLEFLGVKKLVFGSGGARNIPEGFDRDNARAQLLATMKLMGDIAKSHGVTIAIEPLNSSECNVINMVGEACQYAQTLAHENVCVLADYYHMCVENEGSDSILKIPGYGVKLVHVHIANPIGRVYPTVYEDYSEFFSALRQIDYDETVSIEGKSEDILNDCKKSMELFKSIK